VFCVTLVTVGDDGGEVLLQCIHNNIDASHRSSDRHARVLLAGVFYKCVARIYIFFLTTRFFKELLFLMRPNPQFAARTTVVWFLNTLQYIHRLLYIHTQYTLYITAYNFIGCYKIKK